MAEKILKPAGGTVIRVTQIDECGNPLTGGCYAVSECWASAQFAPQYSEGQEFSPMNANGQLCFSVRNPPALKWMLVNIVLNAVSPIAWQLMTAAPLVLDDAAQPNTVGYRLRRGQITRARFALEMWLRSDPDACTPGNVPYIYDITPFIVQGKVGDDQVGQDVITATLNEALAVGPTAWGVGPYNIRKDQVTGTPEPLLTALQTTRGDDDLRHREIVTLAPPPATNGCQLIVPSFTVAPTVGAAAVPRVATFPLGPDGLPILPAIIDWGDLTTTVVTAGTTQNHTYAAPGVYTPKYIPTGYSSPTYIAPAVTVS